MKNALNVLNKTIKYGLYLLVFLMPLWFLPWGSLPLALNKQFFLAIFSFLILIFWIIKIIASGKINLAWSKLTIVIVLLFLILGISTIFSISKSQSFWGASFEPDSFFSFILYILIFFIFANLIGVNQLKSVLISVLAGSGILAILFLIQYWKPIFPWGFARMPGFNPVGSAQALSIFLGGFFITLLALTIQNGLKPISILGRRISEKLVKISIISLGILLLLPILLINFKLTFLGIVFGTILIFWRLLLSYGKTFETKRFILLFLVLVVVFTFIFIKGSLGLGIINIFPEVTPTYRATLNIAKETLLEGPKNFFLGSGPATFGLKYILYKPAGVNLTEFWQIRFNQGAAVLPTLMSTTGILGLLSILLLIFTFFYYGFKNLFKTTENGPLLNLKNTFFIAGFYFFIFWFLYPFNFTLTFSGFLMMALWQSISINQFNQHKSALKEFSFTQSPQKTFFISIFLVLLLSASIFCLYTISKQYSANLNYVQGINLVNQNKIDEGINKIIKAAKLDKRDVYFRELSSAFLLKINQVLLNQQLSQEEKKIELQINVQNGEDFAILATEINPADSLNWFQLALFYENIISLVPQASEFAISNYQKAKELDPRNPQIPFNLARVYFTSDKKEEAKKELEKSLELKNNFQPSLDLLKQISAD